jgi:hypothetical protein
MEASPTWSQAERTGVFIVRGWTEDGALERFRARVTMTPDIEARVPASRATDSKTSIVDALAEWLDSFPANEPSRPEGNPH